MKKTAIGMVAVVVEPSAELELDLFKIDFLQGEDRHASLRDGRRQGFHADG